MSETQVKITGGFDAAGDDGNSYRIVESTIFRRTTTADMAYGAEDGVKEYKLANGAALRRLGEREFEIESSGVKITIPDNL